MPTYYLDYELGNDANDGSDWANAWKTLTLGATAAIIAPGDIIRIAKSPAPVSIGNGTWTNLSKTVTLAAAQNLTIDLCETAWTGVGDTTITRTAVATDGKEGSYCMKLAVDSSPQESILQAYFATGTLDLSAYQKISFWIKNEAVIADATTWVVKLCSDVAGADAVDTFVIPAIPSTLRWIPLTLTKVGGGNLGNAIKSIAIYSGATTPTASKYIYVDNFIACTTAGLNLQSLISKNALEQGGNEGWYGIQSINGVTILLDNDTNCKGNAGRGYSTSGTSPETVTTYKRETIKTDMAASASSAVQQVMDSGTLGNNIEFQGGYDIDTGLQTGETFFDGLNGNGYGIYLITKSYITLNYLNIYRYFYGIYFSSSHYNTIINISNTNNNSGYGVFYYGSNFNTITTLSNANNNGSAAQAGCGYSNSSRFNTIITLSNANNNTGYGVIIDGCNYNTIITLSNANNNGTVGVQISGSYNIITAILNANNNVQYGILTAGSNNIVKSISTAGNTTGGIRYTPGSPNYISNSLCAEATKISNSFAAYSNNRIYATNFQQDTTQHWVFTDGGTINSEATDREGGTGIMWKLAITSTNRDLYYPLKLSVTKIAVVADKLVTVKIFMKKDHATNVGGKLVCPGGQLTGMTVADITDTKADDADTWELLEVTFTPTEAGVVEVEAWAYYVAGNANVYVEDMTITQAD